jgi:hypothetical protein
MEGARRDAIFTPKSNAPGRRCQSRDEAGDDAALRRALNLHCVAR